MEYIAHRINTIEELKNIDIRYGVELDLRDDTDGKIYIEHNPFVRGEDFVAYLEEYVKSHHKGIMILNIKSERIELEVGKLMKKYGINKFFFLDSSFPMIYLLSGENEKRIALRYSEYEGIDTISNMRGKVEWIWVDCFTKIPIDKVSEEKIHSMGYKLCFVSPELQGRQNDVDLYIEKIISEGIVFDAICTKVYNIDKWKRVERAKG